MRNNLKQIGLGPAQLPRGGRQLPRRLPRPGPARAAWTSAQQYRWSALAQMAPYLEQATAANALNFDFPIASKPSGDLSAFLALLPRERDGHGDPDRDLPLPERRGPAPPARLGADELRLLHRRRLRRGRRDRGQRLIRPRPGDLDGRPDRRIERDGRGLRGAPGIAGPYTQTSPTPPPRERNRAFARAWSPPLTETACASAERGWMFHKGAGWWDGNYLNTLYKPPRDAERRRGDCVTYHNPGWRAARSMHPGGSMPSSATGMSHSPRCDRRPHLAWAVHPGRWRGRASRLVLRIHPLPLGKVSRRGG
jgi:hypothetical protein